MGCGRPCRSFYCVLPLQGGLFIWFDPTGGIVIPGLTQNPGYIVIPLARGIFLFLFHFRPVLRPCGDLLSCRNKKVGKEMLSPRLPIVRSYWPTQGNFVIRPPWLITKARRPRQLRPALPYLLRPCSRASLYYYFSKNIKTHTPAHGG